MRFGCGYKPPRDQRAPIHERELKSRGRRISARKIIFRPGKYSGAGKIFRNPQQKICQAAGPRQRKRGTDFLYGNFLPIFFQLQKSDRIF
jgi:hypothetical protein